MSIAERLTRHYMPIPIRCLNGHIIGKISYMEKYLTLKAQNVPLADIFDQMGFGSHTRLCCRVPFMTCPEFGKL